MVKVYYHANCRDGFASALCFWRKYRDDAKYIPISYNDPIPEFDPSDRVYFVDFSYDKKTLEEIHKQVTFLQVIDHHKSREDIKDLPYVIFDIELSGCVLTWEYLYPDIDVPLFLQFIQDRDLWQWEMEYSKESNLFIETLPFKFEEWDRHIPNTHGSQWRFTGRDLLVYQKILVNKICNIWWYDNSIIEGWPKIPVVCSSILQSEVGNELCKQHPDDPFSIVFWQNDYNTKQFSLRSIGDFDVSEIAKRYGGGGHRNAAGFYRTIK